MSYVTTATVNPKSVLGYSNQAILEFGLGEFILWLSYKNKDGNVTSHYVADFNPASEASIHQAITLAEQLCVELGISLLVENPITEHAKGHAMAQFFYELPESGYDYDIYLARYQNECRDKDNVFKPTDEYALDRVDDLCRKIEAEYESLMAFSATHQEVQPVMSGSKVYLACEFDEWRSNNSRVIQGIFSTEEKAIKALTKLYGKLEKDSNGGELGFVPLNNPDDVTLQVVKATLDEVDEV